MKAVFKKITSAFVVCAVSCSMIFAQASVNLTAPDSDEEESSSGRSFPGYGISESEDSAGTVSSSSSEGTEASDAAAEQKQEEPYVDPYEFDVPDEYEFSQLFFEGGAGSTRVTGYAGGNIILGGNYVGNVTVVDDVASAPFKFFLNNDTNSTSVGSLLFKDWARSYGSWKETYSTMTNVGVTQGFSVENFDFLFTGKFNSFKFEGAGVLNNLASNIELLNLDTGMETSIVWNLPYNFKVAGNFNAYYKSIEGSVRDDSSGAASLAVEFTKKNTFVNSIFSASWTDRIVSMGIDTKFDFDWFQGFAFRGQALFNLGFNGERGGVNFMGGAAMGNMMGQNQILVPVALADIHAKPLIKSTGREFVLSIVGGIDSYKDSVYTLEDKYEFTFADSDTEETTDYMGKIYFQIPFGQSVTVDLGAEYRQTAFNNNYYYPNYAGAGSTGDGLVRIIRNDDGSKNMRLKSLFSFAYEYDALKVNANWQSNWLSLLPCEYGQSIALKVQMQTFDEKTGFSAEIIENFTPGRSDAMGYIPKLNLGVFYSFSDHIKVNAEYADLVYSFMGGMRSVAETGFTEKSYLRVLFNFSF